MDDSDEVERCQECIRGKFNCLNMLSREMHKVSWRLERVHSDLCQLPEKSRQGSRYMMTFVDEHTHLGIVLFLECKSKAFSCFKHYVNFVERQTGDKLRIIRTDNSGEYTSFEWDQYCTTLGIKHAMGPPHTPQFNGVAERFNRTLLDCILPSLLKANLPIKFWEDCARHALASINISPTRANENRVAPDDLWSDKPSSYKRLRAFGCKAFRLTTGPFRGGKLSSKSNLGVHLYTLPDGDRWMVWDTALQRPFKTHDAVFHEDCFPGVGPVSQQMADHWVTWSNKNLTPGLQHPVYARTNLYGRNFLSQFTILVTPSTCMRLAFHFQKLLLKKKVFYKTILRQPLPLSLEITLCLNPSQNLRTLRLHLYLHLLRLLV